MKSYYQNQWPQLVCVNYLLNKWNSRPVQTFSDTKMNLPKYENVWAYLFKCMSFKYPVFKTEGGGNGPVNWMPKKEEKRRRKKWRSGAKMALHTWVVYLALQCLSRHTTISSATCLSLAYGTVHSLRSIRSTMTLLLWIIKPGLLLEHWSYLGIVNQPREQQSSQTPLR